MSANNACRCPSRASQAHHIGASRANTKERRANWVVVHYGCNHSSFNGNRWTPSQYSLVACLKCRGSWRTKAHYVFTLPNLTERERAAWAQGTLKIEDVRGSRSSHVHFV